MLKINEIFYSIQGEGYNTGMPAIFVRLSGCNMNCKFCDTEHKKGKTMSEEQIFHEIKSLNCWRVVITGGEPFVQDLTRLVQILKENSYQIFIETNGTIAVKKTLTDQIDWIAMSPKGKILLSRWDEVKLIVNIDTTVENILQQMTTLKKRCPQGMIFLQPEWNKDMLKTAERINWAINLVKEVPGCYLSVQMHKLISIR